MATPAQGAYSVFYARGGTGTQTYQGPTARAFEFITETIQANTTLLEANGIRGVRSMPTVRVRDGIRTVGGSVVINPSPGDLDFWLPWIMGTVEQASNTFPLENTHGPIGIYMGRDTDVLGTTGSFEYTDMYVNRAIFRGQSGSLLELEMEFVGKNETKGLTIPVSPPSIGTNDSFQPFVFMDACSDNSGQIDLPGASADIMDFEVVIDNAMDVRFVQCATADNFRPSDRLVTLTVTVPYDTDHQAFYRPSTRGGAGILKFNNTSASNRYLQFTFQDLKGPDVSPNVGGKGEIVLGLTYRARTTGSSNNTELIIVNDSTGT